MFTILGNIHQDVRINGWIPHDLVISVNNAGKYEMRFNIQTYNIQGKLTVIPCVCEEEEAKKIYDDYRKLSYITVWGQLHSVYYPSTKEIRLYVKILSHTTPYNFNFNVNDPQFNDEKEKEFQELIAYAYDYLEANKTKPSPEQIAYWYERRKKWGGKK